MQPKKKEANAVAKRKAKQEMQEKRIKKVIWITGACIVVLVALLFLIKPQSGSKAEFDYNALPVLGNPEAPIKIVEFGDYKCPACQVFSLNVKPDLQKEYLDTGKAALYFVNYLVISPDADSNTAALAAQSVYHQNKDEFWKYYNAIYENQRDERTEWATPEFLVELARQADIKVDYDQLSKDIADKTYQSEIDKQDALAKKLNVNSTPTLFINGKKAADQSPFDFSLLKKEIEEAQNSK